jgi:hypothetical protein
VPRPFLLRSSQKNSPLPRRMRKISRPLLDVVEERSER